MEINELTIRKILTDHNVDVMVNSWHDVSDIIDVKAAMIRINNGETLMSLLNDPPRNAYVSGRLQRYIS